VDVLGCGADRAELVDIEVGLRGSVAVVAGKEDVPAEFVGGDAELVDIESELVEVEAELIDV
jgi:D-aminopeptidase